MVLLGLVSTGVRPAVAEPPVAVDRLLTDRGEALGTDTATVQRALETLRTETGGALYVVFVSSLDDVAGADWIEDVAAQSDIGSPYLLLAISTDAHTYEWWLGDGAPWDATEVGEVIAAAGAPAVAAGDWAGGIAAVAEGLRTGEIPAATDLGCEDDAPESTASTTTTVVGFLALFVLCTYQFLRRAGVRQE